MMIYKMKVWASSVKGPSREVLYKVKNPMMTKVMTKLMIRVMTRAN